MGVLRRIFGPKRDEVSAEWRKLHNKDLSEMYPSPNSAQVIKLKRMRWAGHVVRTWERGDIHRILVGKPEGKRPIGRPKRRGEGNIKTDLQEVEWGAWTGLIWLGIGTGSGHL